MEAFAVNHYNRVSWQQHAHRWENIVNSIAISIEEEEEEQIKRSLVSFLYAHKDVDGEKEAVYTTRNVSVIIYIWSMDHHILIVIFVSPLRQSLANALFKKRKTR